MVFLIAYAIFEVPSNYLLKKLSPPKWISFLMFSWGALTIGLGGVKSFGSLSGVRFLLGVFEAGEQNPDIVSADFHKLMTPNRPFPGTSLLPDLLVPN
jgi:MFS family permease